MNKRTGWLLFFAILLIVIRVGVSWNGPDGSSGFFQMGGDRHELDPPEERKILLLKNHPVLEQTSSLNGDEESGSPKATVKRNPFLFGRPPAPKKPVFNMPAFKPETIVEENTEVETRFSGKLFGYTELLKSGRKTVCLATSDETLFLEEGELIDGRYAIKEITFEYVTIVDQKSGQELVLTYLDEL